MMYHAAADRYEKMPVRHAGKTGLMLPVISLGLWQHYGNLDPFGPRRSVILDAFDRGVFHFDVANHYGNGDREPGFGSSERLLGQILATDLKPYRDELVISTKVGYEIHPGPYGVGTSRKAVIQGLNDSLKRLQLDYVDIYYAHRFDDTVALEETVNALDQTVRDGKALYIGISNYDTKQTKEAIAMFKDLHTPFVLNQYSYNMFNREAETSGLTKALAKGKEAVVKQLNALNEIAHDRDQTLSQMALAWLLRDPVVTSVIIGTTSVEHLQDNLKATEHLTFTAEEIQQIDDILNA